MEPSNPYYYRVLSTTDTHELNLLQNDGCFILSVLNAPAVTARGRALVSNCGDWPPGTPNLPFLGLTTCEPSKRFCSANSRQQIPDSRPSTRPLLPHVSSLPTPSAITSYDRLRAPQDTRRTHAPFPGPRLEQRWCVIDFARPLQRPINEYCAAGSNPLYTRYACTVLELEHLY